MKIDFRFYAITDRKKISGDRFFDHLESAFAGGLKAIQIREKDLSSVELLRLCERVKNIAGRYKVKTFVNDRVDVMLALDLDGVHLTEQSMPADLVRKIIGNEKLIGVSVHSIENLKAASEASADFAVLGPLAATPSKPQGHPIMLPDEFKRACQSVTIPVFALGGINIYSAGFWIQQEAHGVAGISLWMETPDIATQLKQLEKQLEHL